MEPREGIAEMGLGLAGIAESQRGLPGMVVRLGVGRGRALSLLPGEAQRQSGNGRHVLDPARFAFTGDFAAVRATTEKMLSAIDAAENEKFSAHGLNVRPGTSGRHTLYVVHHGFRESIEVFEIDTKSKTPEVTWIGCVVAPDTATLNAVAPLPDEGFVTTNPYRRGDPTARSRAQKGENSGE